MDYVKHYNRLVEQARQREYDGYVEVHHIVPRCMGGSNEKSNLVALTPEEHYIAHLLLVKIHPSNNSLVYAANMMANRNNKSYGWVRRKFAQTLSEDRKGFKHTKAARKKMSEAGKGKLKPKDWKAKIGESHKKELEYKGSVYKGFEELKEETGVSYHLYNKYYINGIDPEPYINNNTYGMVKQVKKNPPQAALGKKWYNNGKECKYFTPGEEPEGWTKGRLK